MEKQRGRKGMAWKAVRLAAAAPTILLLLLFTYMPRYGLPTSKWEAAIGATCMLIVYIIPLALSVYLFSRAVDNVGSRRKMVVAATIRLAATVILGYLFTASYKFVPWLAEGLGGESLWLDTSFALNPQGYTTIALLSSLVTYLCGRFALIGKDE